MSNNVLLAAALLATSTAGNIERIQDAVDEAAEGAAAAAGEAENSLADEAEQKKLRIEQIGEVQASMRLAESDPSLGEKLPIPRYIYSDTLRAALGFDSAWTDRKATPRKVESALEVTYATGTVLYYEWACQTGKEREVGADYFGFLDKSLTSYPQRLLLKTAINEREMMGYQTERRCSAKALEMWRDRLDLALSRPN